MSSMSDVKSHLKPLPKATIAIAFANLDSKGSGLIDEGIVQEWLVKSRERGQWTHEMEHLLRDRTRHGPVTCSEFQEMVHRFPVVTMKR